MRHSFFAFSMVEELTPFSFHFFHSVQEQYLHDLTQARSPFVDLSTYPLQTMKPASIKSLAASFLKINLPVFEASSLCPPVLPYLLLSRPALPSFPARPIIPSSLLVLCEKWTIF